MVFGINFTVVHLSWFIIIPSFKNGQNLFLRSLFDYADGCVCISLECRHTLLTKELNMMEMESKACKLFFTAKQTHQTKIIQAFGKRYTRYNITP